MKIETQRSLADLNGIANFDYYKFVIKYPTKLRDALIMSYLCVPSTAELSSSGRELLSVCEAFDAKSKFIQMPEDENRLIRVGTKEELWEKLQHSKVSFKFG